MNKFSFYFLLVFLTFPFISLFTSCNQEEINLSDTVAIGSRKGENFLLTPEEAYEIAWEFRCQIDSAEKSRSNLSINDAEILAITKEKPASRDSYSFSSDTAMYLINFSSNMGFALVAADRRLGDNILAISSKGSITNPGMYLHSPQPYNPTYNVGFASFIEMAGNFIDEGLAGLEPRTYPLDPNPGVGGDPVMPWTPDPGDEAPNRIEDYNIIYTIQPMLKTNWGQGNGNGPNTYYDYGRYCPNNTTGCVATALAQIIAHFQCINYISWQTSFNSGSLTLNWQRIMSDCDAHEGKLRANESPQSLDEIAKLGRFIGVSIHADYNRGDVFQTSANSNTALSWLNSATNLYVPSLSRYDEQMIYHAICHRKIVYGNGYSNRGFLGLYYSGGHAWIYDGCIYALNRNTSQNVIMFHCNWGWNGAANGFYLSKVFDTNAGAEIPEARSSSDRNYRYNLKYSIIN